MSKPVTPMWVHVRRVNVRLRETRFMRGTVYPCALTEKQAVCPQAAEGAKDTARLQGEPTSSLVLLAALLPALAVAQRPFGVSLLVALGDRVALVVELLAAGEAELDLHLVCG